MEKQNQQALKQIYETIKQLNHKVISLKININRYDKISIELTITNDQKLDDATLIKAVEDEILQKLSAIKYPLFDLKNLLLISNIAVLKEEFNKEDFVIQFYPEDLCWSMPIPDYKIEMLKHGIPVTATFERSTVKTTVSQTTIKKSPYS